MMSSLLKPCVCIPVVIASFSLSAFADPVDPNAKLLEGLTAADASLANAAVAVCAGKGEAFLPTLRKWSRSDDPRLRLRARSAIGRITGQWGSQTDLIWRKDFKTAAKEAKESVMKDKSGMGKPIMLLQLFGSLNQEYC